MATTNTARRSFDPHIADPLAMRCHYCPRAATVIIRYRVHVWTRGWRIGRSGACSEHESCVAFTSLLSQLGDKIISTTRKAA